MMNKKINRMFSIITLTICFMVGMWAIDIGASAMLFQAGTGVGAVTMGLFGLRQPNTQYHIGMVIVIISFMILAMLHIKKVLEKPSAK